METLSLPSLVLSIALTWHLLGSDSLISAREIPEAPAVSQEAKVTERELPAFAKHSRMPMLMIPARKGKNLSCA